MTTQCDIVSRITAILAIKAIETVSVKFLDCKHVIATEGALSSTETV